MSENEFEKQVRQRMDELRYQPSPEAWSKLEDRLRQDKRRRRPLFVFLLLAGLGLAGFVAYRQLNGRIPADAHSHTVQNEKTNIPAQPAAPGRNHAQAPNPLTETPILTEGPPQPPAAPPVAMDNAPIARLLETNRAAEPGKKTPPVYRNLENSFDAGNEEPLQQRVRHGRRRGSSRKPVMAGEVAKLNTDVTGNNNMAAADPEKKNQQEPAQNPNKVAEPEIPAPVVINPPRHNEPPVLPELARVTPLPKPVAAKKFTWGIQATTGISSSPGFSFMNTGRNLDSAKQKDFSLQANGAFSLGLFGRWNLSDRIDFSAGLNYSVWNTVANLGAGQDSIRVLVTNSQGQPQYITIARDYAAFKFYNRYQYLELPLQLRTRLSNSRQLPVYWNAGLSVGLLMRSRSKLFDHNLRAFYDDGSERSKLLATLNTGFSFGVINKRNWQLNLGPQFQYQINNSLKSAAGKQRISFIGLRTEWSWGK